MLRYGHFTIASINRPQVKMLGGGGGACWAFEYDTVALCPMFKGSGSEIDSRKNSAREGLKNN